MEEKKCECFFGERGRASVTRGFGFLEHFLARKRCRMADKLIADHFRQGKLLDIGCGTYPLFLTQTKFREKVGLDKIGSAGNNNAPGISIVNFDFEQGEDIPFHDDEFDVISMLAVAEHMEPDRLKGCFQEIRRILKDGGVFILTTPAFWTGPILKILACCGLVSRVEIDEHKRLYRIDQLRLMLQSAGFLKGNVRHGYFEVFMNTWIWAHK